MCNLVSRKYLDWTVRDAREANTVTSSVLEPQHDYNSVYKEQCVGGGNDGPRMKDFDTSDNDAEAECVEGSEYDLNMSVVNTITSHGTTSSESMILNAIKYSYSQDKYIQPLLTNSQKE
eukprot:8162107-Pyramimonas_sp.AAC.1